jgi:hypothetical protein
MGQLAEGNVDSICVLGAYELIWDEIWGMAH